MNIILSKMINEVIVSKKPIKAARSPLTCLRCDNSWVPRVEFPSACPACKAYGWDSIPAADKLNCASCNWEWVPRTQSPIACPHCKSYEWKGKKVK